jgi:type I restriction enzyme S subunit
MSRYKAYPEYKDSDVEWLGEIPPHWESRQLKYLCSYNDEVLSETTGDDYEIEYVDIGSVSAIEGISSTETMLFGNAPSRARRIVRDGDILISTVRTYLEAIASVEAPPNNLIASTGFAVIRPNVFLNKGYAAYCLRASGFIKEVVARSVGVSYPAINASDLVNIKTPEPSLPEQEKIAAFLDHETAKIDALIEKQQRLIELLKEKRQAVISHAVTKGLNPNVPMKDSGVEWLGEVPAHWEAKRIKNLSVVKRGASPRPIDEPKYFDDDGEYAWVRIADVSSSGMFLTSTTQRLSSLGSSLSVKLEPNQLFVSIAGTVGKPCLTTFKACIHDGFVYFPELLIDNKFLYYIFAAGEAYLGLGKMGTQLNLNTETVGGITIGVPPADEIMAIIKFIEQATAKYDGLISNAERLIELAQERRTALISAAVTGKIDVRDWQAAA